MTDAQMLERLDKTVFIPAQPEDLTPFPSDELESVSMGQMVELSVLPGDLEPYART